MIQLIGIGKDVDLTIRGALSINSDLLNTKLLLISKFCKEVVIISTCNRTEIYLNSQLNKEDLVNQVFATLQWHGEYKPFTFYCAEAEASMHLLEVGCGFHSKILGEDQILGQIKTAFENSCSLNLVSGELMKLFQLAISCGKEFKTTTKLYEMPVSYSSIAVKKALGLNKKSFLILGLGNMALLALNYLIPKIDCIDNIFIAVRNLPKALESDFIKNNSKHITDEKIKLISTESIKNCYNEVDTIICCTSSPTPLVLAKDLPRKDFLIFDLSLPINVEARVKDLQGISLYNVDVLHTIDLENKALRKKVMENNRTIIHNYLDKFCEYKQLREINTKIIDFKLKGNQITEKRFKVYENKKHTKDNNTLVKTLLQSTSNCYVNKAIEVLKEETCNGNGELALSIIEKIFGRCT
ncbi:Glutamyl-tRNA reductase [bioreactor metagenome]|uniref:glutamyl-tRNA reductase n=1 Tax=bioreactor metagenome TaxID=1076179 RepID=A0A644ZJW7_9ZZZZ